MPWTLYRYMFADLLKLLTVTSAVLVFVLAIGAAIKPLSDGLLGPLSMIKFVGFMAPAMLSLALPFAGAFVGTMLLNRMVSDNEIQVCRASGMNYLLILLPVVFLGCVLMFGMFYMSNWTIPRFCDRAEHALEKDVLSTIVNKIQRGEPIKHGNLILYADSASEGDPKPVPASAKVKPQRLIAMAGVVVGQMDDEGCITRMGSAERADLLLYHAGGESWIVLKLTDPRYIGEDEQGASSQITPLGPYLVPNPFRERLSFLSWPQLRKLQHWPEGYRHVRTAKQRLVSAMASEELVGMLHERLTTKRSVQPLRLRLGGGNQGEEYVLEAPNVRREGNKLWLTASDSAKVKIERFAHGLMLERTFEAEKALLEVVMDPDKDEEPQIVVRPTQVQVDRQSVDGDGAQPSTPLRPSVPELVMRWLAPTGIAKPLRERPLLSLLESVKNAKAPPEPIALAAAQAVGKINGLMRRSRAQFHERAALAVGCMLMVVLGAVLSMKLQRRTVLGVYFWTFLLAAAAVIVTRSGGQLVSIEQLPFGVGAGVIWSGNLLVAAAILTSYWRLEKN